MQKQTAVIHVDAAHHGQMVVTDVAFCMEEAGGVLVDADARPEERHIVGPAQPEHQLLIRDARQDQPDIHAAFCGGLQGVEHLLTHSKIGRVDIHIPLRLGQDVQVDRLGQRLFVQRAVGVGLNDAVRTFRQVGRRKGCVVRLLRAEGVPAVEEDDGKIPDRRPFQPDGGVLPVAEALLGVDIFVREVHAAGVGHIAVDDHDLPVVAVVHHQRHQRHHRVERDAADMAALHPDDEVAGQAQQTAEIIVDQPHVHALGGFPLEDGLDAVPHRARLYNEEFEKDKFFRPFQVFQKPGVHGLAAGEIVSGGVLPRRVGAVGLHVMAQIFLHAVQRVGLVRPGRKVGRVGLLHLPHPGAEPLGRGLVAKGQIQRPAQQRQQADEDDPADLIGAVLVFPDEVEHDDDAQRLEQAVQPDPARRKGPERPEQPQHLQCHQHDGDGGTVEDAAEKFNDRQSEHAVPPPPLRGPLRWS